MSTRPSILPAGMKLVGDVAGDEDFVVFGAVEGEVQVDGAVVVESTGSIRGNVSGRTVAVRGVVIGDVNGRDSIRVESGARIVGDVHAPRVNIVKGALFRGHVHMSGDTPALFAPRPKPAPRKSRGNQPRKRRSAPPTTETPTVPGSVRAFSNEVRDTVVGMEPPAPEPELVPVVVSKPEATDPRPDTQTERQHEPGRPPPPRMPALRRTRARRRDTH